MPPFSPTAPMKPHVAHVRQKSRIGKNPVHSAAANEPHRFSFWVRIVVLAVLAGAGLILLYRHVDVPASLAYARRLNGGLAFALLTVLPLVGFPASVMHVTAGLRFGFALGIALVALSVLLQLLASYVIVNLWRESFARRLARVRKKIPQAAHGPVCLFTLLLPGVPYFIKNYSLVLVGVPFRIYLSWCLPVHVLRAVVTVGLGDQTGRHTPAGLAALAAYWLLILGVSWWAFRRLRRQLADQPAAAGGQKQPA